MKGEKVPDASGHEKVSEPQCKRKFYEVREIEIVAKNICKMGKLKVGKLWNIGPWQASYLWKKNADSSSFFTIHSHLFSFQTHPVYVDFLKSLVTVNYCCDK